MLREIVGPVTWVVAGALLASAALGFLVVPAEVVLPTRWGFDGQPSEWAPRNAALLMPVGLAAVIAAICVAMARFGARGLSAGGRRQLRLLLPALLGLFLVVEIGMVLTGAGVALDMLRLVAAAVGMLVIAIGVGALRYPDAGLPSRRLPWTENNAAAHATQQHVTGRGMIAGGVLVIGAAAVSGWATLLLGGVVAAILVPVLAGALASWVVSRRA